ncbi:Histidine kinase A, variant 2 [Balamuthia mandrillaris]
MSLLRAFRRCKAYDFQHTSEFGFTTLRCFDIPSRTNHVEPFALGGEDGEAEGARFYRVSSSQESMEEGEEGEGIGFSRGHHSGPSFPRRTRLPGPTSGKTVRKSKLPYQNFGRSLSGSNTPTPIIIPRCNTKNKGKEETAEHPYSSSPPMELELPIVAAATATTTGAPMRSRSGSFAEIAAASGALERGASMTAEDVFGKLVVGSPTSSSPLHNLLVTGQKRSVPTFRQTGRDWSKEFQDLLKRPLLERGTELQKLSDEFVATAKSIGEVIIMERNQPYHLKTFKPLQGKGVAGGEKFKVDNIFFKFAIDHNNIYPSDRFAMKVAGHELKGLTAMVSCGMMLGLHFPLLALIDYRGFRLIATSALPISEDTIVYGSCDGGQTVHSDMFEMNTKMEKIAKILNLKGHITGLGDIQKWIYGPCDIEGHRPNDGMLYVVDTARLWPPQTPDRSVKGSFLFNLLRGEYVSKHPIPLSSDAFTMFGEHDAEIHNREVIQATEQLLNVVIPEFAAWLQSHYCHSTAFPLSPSRLIEDLHRTGINIRHLGRVRSHVMDEELRRLILGEMISRFLKNDLKARMRQIQSSEEIPYRRLVINFFNVCFGHKGTESAAFWSRYAPKELLLQFEFALSPQEQKPDFKLYEHIHLPQVFERTSELTGVKFRSSTCPLLSELTDRDLVSIDVKEKHMYAIPRIEADTLAQLALIKPMEEAQQLYSASLAKYHSVLHLKADDHLVLQVEFFSPCFPSFAASFLYNDDPVIINAHNEEHGNSVGKNGEIGISRR